MRDYMTKEQILGRLTDIAEDGRVLMRRVADDVGTGAKDAAFKAKKNLVRGRRVIRTAEESISRQAKDHPVAFMLIGVAIASAIAASLLLGNSSRED